LLIFGDGFSLEIGSFLGLKAGRDGSVLLEET
jgi:hypothetical protein